jgi:hypothetical protein
MNDATINQAVAVEETYYGMNYDELREFVRMSLLSGDNRQNRNTRILDDETSLLGFLDDAAVS